MPSQLVSLDVVRRLRYAAGGGTRASWHGSCTNPVERFVRGVPDKLLIAVGAHSEQTQPFTFTVRCRRCDACLRHRGFVWAKRAQTEMRTAHRTWFVTLTLSPDRQTWSALSARAALAKAVADVTPQNLFIRQAAAVEPEVQRWLKRVRKNSGARLRYLQVCEAHKSGVPHWHLLVHENGQDRVTERNLRLAWRYGFSQAKLVRHDDDKAAWYVCKYAAKAALVKIRASQKYGDAIGAYTESLSGLDAALRGLKDRGAANPV
ncbi:replication associated protein [Microviridae sp.]|nr:replication associated protein [Microviridae sp.]